MEAEAVNRPAFFHEALDRNKGICKEGGMMNETRRQLISRVSAA